MIYDGARGDTILNTLASMREWKAATDAVRKLIIVSSDQTVYVQQTIA
jgi:hypothetical protein